MVLGRVGAGGLVATYLAAATGAVVLARLAWQPAQTRTELVARTAVLPADVAPREALAAADLAAGRPAAALRRLDQALGHSSFSARLWLAAAEVALQLGRTDQAVAAAEQAHALAPTDAAGCERAALVLMQAERNLEATPLLRCVATFRPKRAPAVFDLALAVFGDDAVVRERVTPPGVEGQRAFLAWAYEHRMVGAALRAWEAFAPTGAGDRLRQIDFLLAQGQVEPAEQLWSAAYGLRDRNLVFDGGFEDDPVGAGFGWWIRDARGVRARLAGGHAAAAGARGLAIEFSGGNVSFDQVTQIVPVQGDRRYRLSALVRTEGVTSLSGPRLRVDEHPGCPGLEPTNGPDWLGTRPWEPTGLEFTTPKGCQAVTVQVRRLPTERLDRDIRGRAYVDEVALRDLGDATESVAAEPTGEQAAALAPGW